MLVFRSFFMLSKLSIDRVGISMEIRGSFENPDMPEYPPGFMELEKNP